MYIYLFSQLINKQVCVILQNVIFKMVTDINFVRQFQNFIVSICN